LEWRKINSQNSECLYFPQADSRQLVTEELKIACTDLNTLVHETKRKLLFNADVHEQLDNIYWRQGAVVEREPVKKH